MEENSWRITETILRDAHQSQAATRMRIEEYVRLRAPGQHGRPVAGVLGGATFDVWHALPERGPVAVCAP